MEIGKVLHLLVKGVGLALLVSLVCIIIYLLLPAVLSAPDRVVLETFLGVASILSIVIAGVLAGIAQLLTMVEVLRAKNDNMWKVIWFVIVLVPLGFVVYWFWGRKDLR